MNKQYDQNKAGYYFLTIQAGDGRTLLASNNERAYIVTQLQDILSMRSLLEDSEAYLRLASHIDLLAYSIQKQHIQLLLFAIAESSARTLGTMLSQRLVHYQSEWRTVKSKPMAASIPYVSIKKLIGPHQALQSSLDLHLAHSDWEYDRYSSIGFYLHDRRGDWMRIWRLSYLYDALPTNYRHHIQSSVPISKATLTPASLV